MQFNGKAMHYSTLYHGTRVITRLGDNLYEVRGKGDFVRCIHEKETNHISYLTYPEGPSFGLGKYLNDRKIVKIECINVPKSYDHVYQILTSD